MVMLSELSIVRAAHVVLACTSAHRASMLNDQLGARARCVPPGPVPDADAIDPAECAKHKALGVFEKCNAPFQKQHGRRPSLIVGVETVVSLGDRVLGKPDSLAEARSMLTQLAEAGSHRVTTGVALVYGDPSGGSDPIHVNTFVDETTVELDANAMSEAEVEAYVASGECMLHPGAYSVHGLGSAFAKRLDGDHTNAEYGFPLHRFLSEVDSSRLQAWLDAAPEDRPIAVAEEPPPPAWEPPISPDLDPDLVCEDDECGLPSD